jgi:predicted amidophosphoribosyltransferase
MKQSNKTTKSNNVRDNLKNKIICKYCKKSIDQTKLVGFSLICPLCGKPQNGVPHHKK